MTPVTIAESPYLQRPNVQDQLPPLQLREVAERRHAGVCVAGADFPEQGAIGLCLNVSSCEVGRFARAASLVAVAVRASLLEDLGSATRGVRMGQEWVHPSRFPGRRQPIVIARPRLRERY